MQKIATRVFIAASIAFGVFGMLVIITLPANDNTNSPVNMLFLRLLFASAFVVLPSFALSVASKYLGGKS
jgi:hypothetical protein